MRILIIGATGNSGLALTRLALSRGHAVTAFVRSEGKLKASLGPTAELSNLSVHVGNLSDLAGLSKAMEGQDVVINAAGNATVDADYVQMVQSVISTADRVLGADGRFWFFGGAAALDVPGTGIRTAELPLIPKLFRQHLENLAFATATSLDWSMLCPGPMITSPSGQPHQDLRISTDIWPVEGPGTNRLFKTIRALAAFKKRMPEMIISYEDAAKIILDNLEPGGRFAKKRVGAALPKGLTASKSLNF